MLILSIQMKIFFFFFSSTFIILLLNNILLNGESVIVGCLEQTCSCIDRVIIDSNEGCRLSRLDQMWLLRLLYTKVYIEKSQSGQQNLYLWLLSARAL